MKSMKCMKRYKKSISMIDAADSFVIYYDHSEKPMVAKTLREGQRKCAGHL